MQKQTTKTLKTKEIVKRLLFDKPKTNSDDPLLYMAVVTQKGWHKMPMYELLTRLPYQSVTRYRRYWQDQFPELETDKKYERIAIQRRKQKEFRPSYWDKLRRMVGK